MSEALANPGSMVAVPPTYESLLITCEYNPAAVDGVGPGLAWVIMHDNPAMAWLVDTMAAVQPQPVILGSMPATPPTTAGVMSPAWATGTKGTVYVPNMWRGTAMEFFTMVASNNGVQRRIYAKFADATLDMAWQQWANSNPTLMLKEPPNV